MHYYNLFIFTFILPCFFSYHLYFPVLFYILTFAISCHWSLLVSLNSRNFFFNFTEQDFHQENIFWRTFKQLKASLSDGLIKTATPGSVLFVRNAARYLCAMVKHVSENEINDTIVFLMRSGCTDAQYEIIKLLNGELMLSNTALFQCCTDMIYVVQFTDPLYFEVWKCYSFPLNVNLLFFKQTRRKKEETTT